MSEKGVIKINSKPLEKLIGVIRKGLGSHISKTEIKKDSVDTEEEQSKANLHPDENINERIKYKESKRQQNLDYINFVAAEQLSNEETVSDEPVEEDWVTRFFNYAQDISNDEMQGLWAKILAGEVKRPQSFSLRTLELLRNLTKREAEVFNKAANLVVNSSWGKPFIYREDENGQSQTGLTFEDRLLLMELGILQAETSIVRRIPQQSEDSQFYFELGRYLIQLTKKANSPEHQIPIYRFSLIGEELLKLIVSNPPQDYVKDSCMSMKNEHLDTKYSFILMKMDDEFRHTLPWQSFQ